MYYTVHLKFFLHTLPTSTKAASAMPQQLAEPSLSVSHLSKSPRAPAFCSPNLEGTPTLDKNMAENAGPANLWQRRPRLFLMPLATWFAPTRLCKFVEVPTLSRSTKFEASQAHIAADFLSSCTGWQDLSLTLLALTEPSVCSSSLKYNGLCLSAW